MTKPFIRVHFASASVIALTMCASPASADAKAGIAEPANAITYLAETGERVPQEFTADHDSATGLPSVFTVTDTPAILSAIPRNGQGLALDTQSRARPSRSGGGPPPNIRRGGGRPETWQFAIGAGALLSPNYTGDDQYGLSLVPYFRVSKGSKFVASVQEGIEYKAIQAGAVSAGPRISYEFGRQEDGTGPFRIIGGSNDDLRGLGDVDPSLGLGGFVDIDLGNKVSFTSKIDKAITGVKGLRAEFGLRYSGISGNRRSPTIYSFGPSLEYSDGKTNRAFFGVTAAQSSASGLPQYRLSGGLTKLGIGGNIITPIGRKLSLGVITSYSRLLGPVADSPLVEQRGSPNQGFLALVTSYIF